MARNEMSGWHFRPGGAALLPKEFASRWAGQEAINKAKQ